MFSAIFGWLAQLWSILQVPLFSAYGLNISMQDIFVGALVTLFVIGVFWKGARA